MFKNGDLVIHHYYGLGTVVNICTMKVTANEQIYYTIDLAGGENLVSRLDQGIPEE